MVLGGVWSWCGCGYMHCHRAVIRRVQDEGASPLEQLESEESDAHLELVLALRLATPPGPHLHGS